MKDLLLRLFNLDGVDFNTPGGWSLRFMSEWAPPVIVFGCLALVLLVWQVYKREKGTATARFKFMLAMFRLMALAVLIFVLLVPAVVVRKSELKESYVIILADKSDSMDLKDRYRDEKLVARLAYATGLAETLDPAGRIDPDIADRVRAMSRAEIANRVLSNPKFDLASRIAQNSRVRQFVFAATVAPAPTVSVKPPETSDPEVKPEKVIVRPLLIVPDGPTTQIGDCIRDAIAELRGQRIAAMVVISDWCSNSGMTPTDATRYALDPASSFPIFTVGVGDPADQRDIIVSSVSANAVAFLNDPLIFNVAVEQVGYDGVTVPLEVRIGDEVVAREDITLKPGRKYYTVTYRPTKKGVFKCVISVPPRNDELSAKNNLAEHTVTVKDDKVRVLLISGGPSWEWRYLKAALARDKSVTVSVWLQSADDNWVMAGGEQLTNLPLNKKELVEKYDAIVLLAASANAFSNEQLEHIKSFVGDFGGGLIFCAGAQVVSEAFAKTPLAQCLPVMLEPPPGFSPSSASGHSFQPRITPEGWAHPAMRLSEDAHQNRELWASLAGLFWFHPVQKVKPAARVLAVHPEEKSERGPFPIFVEQRYGAGRTFFSATDETWRWRFLVGDKYFYRFWRQIVGLMASNKLLGGAKRLTLAVAKNKYIVGQRVEIQAKLLDEMLRPADAKSLTATLDLPGGATQNIKLSVSDPTQGTYRGSLVARKVGDYAVWLRPGPGEKPETVPFSVTMSMLESESRRLNTEMMEAVARRTSAAAFMIDQIGRIPEKVKGEAENIVTEQTTEIWDSWGCLILFAIPLTAEWWLRKRRLLT